MVAADLEILFCGIRCFAERLRQPFEWRRILTITINNYAKYRQSVAAQCSSTGVAVEEWAKSTGGIWLENKDLYKITDLDGVASFGRFCGSSLNDSADFDDWSAALRNFFQNPAALFAYDTKLSKDGFKNLKMPEKIAQQCDLCTFSVRTTPGGSTFAMTVAVRKLQYRLPRAKVQVSAEIQRFVDQARAFNEPVLTKAPEPKYRNNSDAKVKCPYCRFITTENELDDHIKNGHFFCTEPDCGAVVTKKGGALHMFKTHRNAAKTSSASVSLKSGSQKSGSLKKRMIEDISQRATRADARR